MTEAYSSVGRTYVVNARAMSGKLRERKHRIICEARKWALETMTRMWSTNFKFGSTIIPRSLTTSERLIVSFQETILMLRIAVAEVEYRAL